MNKMQMYIKLQEMIFAGHCTAELIIDCPHQFKEYSNYVVFELVKQTPIKQIAPNVALAIAKEISAELDAPNFYRKIANEVYRVVQSYRFRRQIKHNKSSNVLSFGKNVNKSKS